jgi:hypothetical protein
MIVVKAGDTFTAPSNIDIVIMIDRTSSMSTGDDTVSELCADAIIDNLPASGQVKVYAARSPGQGNLSDTGIDPSNNFFDPYIDDNSNGGPEGFDNTVSELKEAVDYVIGLTASGATDEPDEWWRDASGIASDLGWSEAVKTLGNRYLIYIGDDEDSLDSTERQAAFNEMLLHNVSPIYININASSPIAGWDRTIYNTPPVVNNWLSLAGETFYYENSETTFADLITYISGL